VRSATFYLGLAYFATKTYCAWMARRVLGHEHCTPISRVFWVLDFFYPTPCVWSKELRNVRPGLQRGLLAVSLLWSAFWWTFVAVLLYRA